MPSYQLYWRTGKHETLKGRTIADAMNKHYSRGALAALDFYVEGEAVEYEWDGKERKWNKTGGSHE